MYRSGITNLNHFGSHEYSKEELIAEMGAAYLCGITKITSETITNSTAYIDSWLKRLQENNKWLIQAASKGQKAANYVQGKV